MKQENQKISTPSFRKISHYLSTLFMCGVLVISSTAVADEIYRWTDAAGKSHFSANPPKGAKNVTPLSQGRFSKYSTEKMLKGYKRASISAAIEQQLKGSDAEKKHHDNTRQDDVIVAEKGIVDKSIAEQPAAVPIITNTTTFSSTTDEPKGKFFREKDLPTGMNLGLVGETNSAGDTKEQIDNNKKPINEANSTVAKEKIVINATKQANHQTNEIDSQGPALTHTTPVVKWGQNGDVLGCSVKVRNATLFPAKEVFVTFEFSDGTLLPASGPSEIEGYSEETFALPRELLPLNLRKVAEKGTNELPTVNVQSE